MFRTAFLALYAYQLASAHSVLGFMTENPILSNDKERNFPTNEYNMFLTTQIGKKDDWISLITNQIELKQRTRPAPWFARHK